MFKASGGWGQITGQMSSHLELKASSSPTCTSSATLWHWSYNLPLFRSLLESISRSPKPSTEHIKMHSQAWMLPLLLRNHPTLQGIDFLPVERSLQEHTFCFHMQRFTGSSRLVLNKAPPPGGETKVQRWGRHFLSTFLAATQELCHHCYLYSCPGLQPSGLVDFCWSCVTMSFCGNNTQNLLGEEEAGMLFGREWIISAPISCLGKAATHTPPIDRKQELARLRM